MATTGTITTERQALVALAAQFQALKEATEDLDITAVLSAALAVIAGGLVVSGAALYRPGELGAVTLTPTGQIRVLPSDPQVAWFGPSPFDGTVAWEAFAEAQVWEV